MKAALSGKIVSQKIVGTRTQTIIAEPSQDEYAQPSSFKVLSDYSLGQDGHIVKLHCEFNGFVKSKTYNDKATGQPKVYEEQILFINASMAPANSQLKQA